MKSSVPQWANSVSDYNERFLQFLKLFSDIDTDENLFPRECRVCGTRFRNVGEYCQSTNPKGHCFEDCRNLSKSKPFMMLYRHCKCGNTLVLTITEQAFPHLNAFWQMLHDEASDSERLIKEVIAEFADQFDRFVLDFNKSCDEREE